MKLIILDSTYCVCRFSQEASLPQWFDKNSFWSLTRTEDELSLVCLERDLPPEVKAETGWRIIKVQGPLDFGLTGILSSITEPLARAKISIFAVSTFDTDYILVKDNKLPEVKTVLKEAGFEI